MTGLHFVNYPNIYRSIHSAVVVGASSKVDTIYTNVVTLETDITSINGNIKICKDVFQDCQDGGGDCYTQAGIDSTIFDNPFDVATVSNLLYYCK